MRRIVFGIPFLALVLWLIVPAKATIDSSNRFSLDLTKPEEAAKKAEWSEPDQFTVTAEGLGWSPSTAKDPNSSRDFWLQTEAIAIGYSWRPTSVAMVRATIDRPGRSGQLYSRYSADRKHWTTWQPLDATGPANEYPGKFQGAVRVPYRESARYQEMRMAYARREDVPWPSDEEALVKELLHKEPKFFETVTPFIGYVQFLYEAQIQGGHHIKGFAVDVSWWASGKHLPPKGKNTYDHGRDAPWRFKAD